MKYVLTWSLIGLLSFVASAQISGTITEVKNKKPVADVEVFIDGTSYITLSDETGKFVINGLLPGFADLVLYKNGYQLFKSSVRIQEGKAYVLNLTLEPTGKEKIAKGNGAATNEEALQKLENVLFGKENANFCDILNEEVLSFSKTDEPIVVKSIGPLVINNNILGLQLRFFLQNAFLTKDKEDLHGYVNFQPLTAQSSDQMAMWRDNRLAAYQGSARHLFRSLVEGKAEQDGFEWRDKQGKTFPSATVLTNSSIPGYHKLILSDTTEVRYKTKTGVTQSTRLIQQGSIEINKRGKLLNDKNLKILDHLASVTLSALLPHDYEPIVSSQDDYMRFYEKVYVHTDKPYYYPGEPMWFKGYINYKNPAWRDSLSKVMYVELINPKKEIALTKTLKIDSGFFFNDFILPDTLKEGTYYLRAYTNLNRNFGDSSLFVRTVPILNIIDKVDRAMGKTEVIKNETLSITAGKQTYKTREKITLTITAKDKSENPLASNVSLAVTDAIQVVPIAEPLTIMNGYPLAKAQEGRGMEFTYPLEYGVSINGKFVNDKGKPEKTTLTILQTKPRNMMLAETNEQGFFSQTGLNFYDTATFSFKSDKAKNYPYGKVELLPREAASVNFKVSSHNLTVQTTQSQQRIISEYEVPKDVRLLEGVTIKAKKIEEQNNVRPYGKGDYVLKAKDIKSSYGNILYSLQGTIPGLIVQNDGSSWQVFTTRARTSSASNSREVLVLVNNVPMAGNPGDILSTIDPATVESIEVTTRVNVLLGSLGASGLIYVYTKLGASGEETKVTPNFQTIKTYGYSSARNFRSPDYDNKDTDKKAADYRSTLYWNPEIETDSKAGTSTVSFFAADLPGTYRIVGEGVLQTGEPVRCVYFITVESD